MQKSYAQTDPGFVSLLSTSPLDPFLMGIVLCFFHIGKNASFCLLQCYRVDKLCVREAGHLEGTDISVPKEKGHFFLFKRIK